MIRLLACIHTQTNYQTSYRPLPKRVPDGWSVFSINRANVILATRLLRIKGPRNPWQICVVSLVGCLSVLNFRAQITANQRHNKRTRISGELSHECGIFGAKNRPLFVRAFFPLSTTREAEKREPGNVVAFLINFASVVIVNLSTSWFADVWQTHPMQMSVSWYMV